MLLSHRFLSCLECQGERDGRCSMCAPAIAAVLERVRLAERQDEETDQVNLVETEARGKRIYQRAVVRGGDLEWLLHTLHYLDTTSLISFATISRYLVALLSSDDIWKTLFMKQYPRVRIDRALLPRTSGFWRRCYRMEYTHRQHYPGCDSFYSLFHRYCDSNIVRWTQEQVDAEDLITKQTPDRFNTPYHVPPEYHAIWDQCFTYQADAGIPHHEIFTMHDRLYHMHPMDRIHQQRSIFFDPEISTYRLGFHGSWEEHERQKNADGILETKKWNDEVAWSMLLGRFKDLVKGREQQQQAMGESTDRWRNMKRHCLVTLVQSIAKKRIITHYHQSKRQNIMEQVAIYVHDTAIRILSSRYHRALLMPCEVLRSIRIMMAHHVA